MSAPPVGRILQLPRETGQDPLADQWFKAKLGHAAHGIRHQQHFALDIRNSQLGLIYDHINTQMMHTVLHLGHRLELLSGRHKKNVHIFFTEALTFYIKNFLSSKGARDNVKFRCKIRKRLA